MVSGVLGGIVETQTQSCVVLTYGVSFVLQCFWTLAFERFPMGV